MNLPPRIDHAPRTERTDRVLVALGAAVPAGAVAGLADAAMAGQAALHAVGLMTAMGLGVGLAQGALLALVPRTLSLRARATSAVAWFSGDDGAARLLALSTALLGLLIAATATASSLAAGHRHAGLIAVATAAAVAAEAALAAVLVPALVTAWRALLRFLGGPSPAAALVVVTALVGGWAAWVALTEPAPGEADYRPVVVILAFAATQAVTGSLLLRRHRAVPFLLVLGGVAAALLLVGRAAIAPAGSIDRLPVSAHLAAALRHATDRDGDGHSALFGGGDCDDRDPSAHEGAPDPPGDGLDRNCDGVD